MSLYSKKKTKYRILSVFLLLLFLVTSTPWPVKTAHANEFTELVLIWNTPLSASKAETYLASGYPGLSLTEHEGDYSLCKIRSGFSCEELLRDLRRDAAFAAAEPNFPLESYDFALPDDPYIDSLWAYDNPGFYNHYYGSFPITQETTYGIDMNIWDAWAQYPISKEDTRTVTIAVIDTGIDYQHPDLINQMWINTNEIPDNGIDDDGNGYVDDIYGWDFYHNDSSICHYIETANGYTANPDDNDNHGTHIAGIIAASAGNSIGIAGVAANTNVRLMSLKIHGGTGSSGSVANAIKAIRYAESMGADICNLSWGTTNYSQALEIVIRESSMLFVTAAGNNGINNNSTPVFPANLRLPNLLSVAFIDSKGNLDSTSNYGVSTVDIAAPGKDIYSTLVGTYGYSSGSSMAAPHVTGLAAMIYAYHEHVYPSQVKELIINTMTPLEQLDGYLINPGIPDAAAAIRSLSLIQPDAEAPFLTLETGYEKDKISVSVSAYDVGGSGIRKVRYAYGSKPAELFTSDSDSTAILDDRILLAKGGYYTFYVEDYAGNHNLYNYYVADDTTAPDYTASYSVAPDYSCITVSLSASDPDSGLKTLKYLAGEFTADYFLFSGEPLDVTLKKHSIVITPSITALTFYMADYRGNTSCFTLYPKIVQATSLHLNVSERSLEYGKSFRLHALPFPWNTTDGVLYHSSAPDILTVDNTGLVTAVGEGTALIYAMTHSGILSSCHVTVTGAPFEVNPEEEPSETASGSALIPSDDTPDQEP